MLRGRGSSVIWRVGRRGDSFGRRRGDRERLREAGEGDGGGGDGERRGDWEEDGGGGGGAEGEVGDGVEPLVPEPEAVAPALVPEPAPQVDRRAGPRQPLAPPGGGAAGVRAGAGVLSTDGALFQEGQGEGNNASGCYSSLESTAHSH